MSLLSIDMKIKVCAKDQHLAHLKDLIVLILLTLDKRET